MNDEAAKRISALIRKARSEKGLTQQALGEKLGYTGRTAELTIQHWERATRLPGLEIVRKLSEVLDVKLDDLIP